MSIAPIITFKAGRCDINTDSRPHKVTPDPTPGYIYLYSEDDLVHFCWRQRSTTMDDDDNLDLTMFPTDGHFEPYEYKTSEQPTSKTNGRIFVLKFSSSSQRHLFWLQSKPQARNGDSSWFSTRDLKIGQIVDTLLQGEDVDVSEEIAQIRSGNDGNDDEDETMDDVEGEGDEHHRTGSGGAGADATGGDIREEGAESREGGADGGRAASSGQTDAAMVVQNFLNSLKGGQGMSQQQTRGDRLFTTLPDLLPSKATIPIIDASSVEEIDSLLSYLPPTIVLLGLGSAASSEATLANPSPASVSAAMKALSLDQKKLILKRVLRSPQFQQSLSSLTAALRDGGLPSISDALKIQVQNGGLIRGGNVPLGGGAAVEAFLEGVKSTIEKE